ncbi:uncharacterized protein LOC131239338 [Magnolia sinica]|uniref:uncharacterized protein LOC131239338 n=1 Tax=Magnolia sinica TaxID=86752 RepID=UPI002658976F|nr:uncharacterized protein LOC131239338 [Magnolia sinica]
MFRHSTSMASPPSNPQCRRTGTPNWRCPEMALPGKTVCEKHWWQYMRDYLKTLLSNEKDDECEILSPKNNQSKGKGKSPNGDGSKGKKEKKSPNGDELKGKKRKSPNGDVSKGKKRKSPNGDESKGKKRKSPNGDESKGKKKKSLNDNSSKGNKKSRAVEGERDKVRKKTGRKIEDGSGKKGRVENIGMHSEGSLVLDPLLMSPQPKKGLLVGNSALLELLKDGTGDTAKSAAPNAKTEGTSRESPTMQDQNLTLSPQFMARRSRIFDFLPQNPHYLPLASYSREVRKGIIGGLDIAFVALSEKFLTLKSENIGYEIGDVMKQLSDLEQMGYNVQKLKQRLDFFERYLAPEEMVMNSETEARAHELKVGSAEDRISAFASRISELERKLRR